MARLPELEAFCDRARPAADLDRRPHPLPAPEREARQAGRRGAHPDRVGRVHVLRVRVAARRRAAPRVRARRGAGRGERARARAQRVPHRRRVRLAALRLRPAARTRRWSRSPTRASAWSSTCAATRAAASASATSCGPTTLQDQGHDTVDANLELGLPVDSREYGIGAQILVDLGITTMRLHDQQPGQVRRPRGLRPRDHRARVPLRSRRTRENIALPTHQARAHGPSSSSWPATGTKWSGSTCPRQCWPSPRFAGRHCRRRSPDD